MLINLKKSIPMFIIIILLVNCKDNAPESHEKNTEPQKPELTSIDIQSKKALKQATVSLAKVPEEFQWRDTYLILESSHNAFNENNYSLSLELANKVVKQSELMLEQKEFAENNWQKLLPDSTSQ